VFVDRHSFEARFAWKEREGRPTPGRVRVPPDPLSFDTRPCSLESGLGADVRGRSFISLHL